MIDDRKIKIFCVLHRTPHDACIRNGPPVVGYGDGTSSLDARLATSGVVRRIGLSTPHFMAVLATVAGTDMVATTSMLFAKSFAKAYRLRVSEVAFLDMRLSSTIVGSSVRMSDPVMQWFCNVVRIVSEDVRKAVFGDKSASSPSRRTSP